MTSPDESENCDGKTEVYTRVVGFYRPISQWNEAKQEEFNDRTDFDVNIGDDTNEPK